MPETLTLADTLADLIASAKAAGADAADAIVVDGASVSVTYRLGKLEQLERSEGGDIGLRVLIGKRQAIVSSADRSREALKELVERAVAMARTVPEDPYCGLASADQIAKSLPALDICDPKEVSAETLIAKAAACEEAARGIEGVTNSDGASASWGKSQVAIAASNGFMRSYESSGSSMSVSVIAGDSEQGMETDYDYTSAVYFADLKSPEEIGRSAGNRAVRKLGGRKMASCRVPLIFDPRVARGLISHFLGAINGASVARGTTFLKDAMDTEVFAAGLNVIEEPHRQRGLRSKPCDAEGLPNRKRILIDNGRLTTWILDLRAARQLNLTPTGHAARSPGGPPSPSATNVYLAAGAETPEALMADIKEGFYITDLVGQGINMVTGDYSRGAVGFWIENGKTAYPVSEVTIAGNLTQMFKAIRPANDLELLYGVDAPTVRIDGMTVAGT